MLPGEPGTRWALCECYIIPKNSVKDLIPVIKNLESINVDGFVLFVDRISRYSRFLGEYLQSRTSPNWAIVATDTLSTWEKKVAVNLARFCRENFEVNRINESDAMAILDKVERFGRWTRLGRMSEEDRIAEFIVKAGRQLLIGLLETTQGVGYEKIIENDFARIDSDEEKNFFLLIGLATRHRSSLSREQVIKAMDCIGVETNVNILLKKLAGIVIEKQGYLSARHESYVGYIFDKLIRKDELQSVIMALLDSYSMYQQPLIKYVNANDATVYKGLLNHDFLKEVFRHDEDAVRSIYYNYEKIFQSDGHFWLQYGLSLRDFKNHFEAYDKLRVAFEVYPQPFAEHALGQQLLILALIAKSEIKAKHFFGEGMDILSRLDSQNYVGDTYPIIAMAEGHIQYEQKVHGEDAARVVARNYANVLDERRKRNYSDKRLQKAWSQIAMFGTTGTSWDGVLSDVSAST